MKRRRRSKGRETRRGPGQPGPKIRGHAPQRRICRTQRIGAAASCRPRPKANFQGEISETEFHGQKILLLWPHTFMNLSGASVLAARDFYKLDTSELLIVCDDFNLPLAKLRMRPEGSSGGQNGLDDVINRLGTERCRGCGLASGPCPRIGIRPILCCRGSPKKNCRRLSPRSVRAADAVEDWTKIGIAECMNRYNA